MGVKEEIFYINKCSTVFIDMIASETWKAQGILAPRYK